MSIKKRHDYLFVFDYDVDPDLSHDVINDELDDFIRYEAKGGAVKIGKCLLVRDPDDALSIKLRFGDAAVST